jgi:formylglycine-generating enzyme
VQWHNNWSGVAVLAASLGPLAVAAQPAARVPIAGFAIDRTEVTIGAFRAYAAAKSVMTTAERDGAGYEYAGGWVLRPGWSWQSPYGVRGADDEPAVHVSWAEADAYCRHVGGRLPTFAEWRQAAYTEMREAPTDGFVRTQTYTYPVGDAPDGMNNSRQRHAAVATTKRGVNGLYDMGGNVWEWTADRRGEEAMTAGGSWWYGPAMTRAEGAQWKAASFFAVYIGFRCAYDLTR